MYFKFIANYVLYRGGVFVGLYKQCMRLHHQQSVEHGRFSAELTQFLRSHVRDNSRFTTDTLWFTIQYSVARSFGLWSDQQISK